MWLIYSFRAIEKILPALKGKQKWGWVAPFALCFVILLAALGFGIYVDGYVIHPPAQYTGLCGPPAQITKGNCIEITTEVVTVAGTVTTVTRSVQGGTILNVTTAKK